MFLKRLIENDLVVSVFKYYLDFDLVCFIDIEFFKYLIF